MSSTLTIPSSVCPTAPTTDQTQSPQKPPCNCACRRFNPYRRPSQQRSSIIGVNSLDFPSYNETLTFAFPSMEIFNSDANLTLTLDRQSPSTDDFNDRRKGKRRHSYCHGNTPKSKPQSRFNRDIQFSPMTTHLSYFLERLEAETESAVPIFRYRDENQEEDTERRVKRMGDVVKGFEKGFWQV